MPNLKAHCDISKRRTGKRYEELHRWMDEATAYLGHNHRLERHFFTSEYKDYITKEWGAKAVVEWLFHIAIDNLETANKFAVDEYRVSFDEIDFIFDGKNLVQCNCIKKTAGGNRKSIEISLKEKEKINRVIEEKASSKDKKPKKRFYKFRKHRF